MNYPWHTLSIIRVSHLLKSQEGGLTSREAYQRLEKFGRNVLPDAKVESLFYIFLRQFASPLVFILIAAGFLLFLTGKVVDGLVVLFVLVFNATVGTVQEGRAQNIFLALRKMVETKSVVLRDNKEVIVIDKNIVPGDVIFLEEGEKAPADARLLTVYDLKMDESSFTGESGPVVKTADELKDPKLAVPERANMVFKGTHVLGGKGTAIVVETGINTKIGKITSEISRINTEIPLKKEIEKLSRIIIWVVLGLSLILFSIGIIQNKEIVEMFSVVIALIVSIVPEGLPIVITLVLATGVWRMSKKNALVKKLQAVEALGQAQVIAIDKTGTLTKNKMMVQKVYVNGKTFDVGGSEYEPKGEILLEGKKADLRKNPELVFTGKIAAITARARIFFVEVSRKWKISGDPTEAAMLAFAGKAGVEKEVALQHWSMVSEMPFDYKKKFRVTFHKSGKKFLAVYSGAPESVLKYSKKIYAGKGKICTLGRRERKELEKIYLNLSKEGLRLVAFAIKEGRDLKGIENPESLTFVSFLAIKDVIRLEVAEAIGEAKSAGLKVVMITGDHKLTAEALAREAGIFKSGDKIVTGEELDEMTAAEIARHFGKISVFARVTPDQKLKIINVYRSRGDIVAMTGDGVNDAPSLIAADLGIAMGKIGTEVAKEASDIVLLDDNFSSITQAIEEGRNIYMNIKKVILYLFSTSLGEVLTIGSALALSLPIPLLPTQIIWLNLVTDGFLDVSLAMEPKEKGLLKKSARGKQQIFDRLMVVRMIIMAIPMALGTFFLFHFYLKEDLAKAWTISLTTLAVFQWFNAWNCRREEKSIFRTNFFSNKFLLAATVIVIVLQFTAVYSSLGHKILGTVPISVFEWTLIVAVASSIVFTEEFRKLIFRNFFKTAD